MREALVYAVGIAISPVPIATVLLLLTTRRAVANGMSFLAGWIVGVAALTLTVVVLANELGVSHADPVLFGVAEVLFGVAFLLAAFAVWRRRHRHAEREPPWLDRVDRMTSARSAGLGIVLSGVNPKIAALSFAAALALAEENADTAVTAETVILFSVIATIGVLVPLALYIAAPSRAESALRSFRGWLGRNDAVVLAAVGSLIGGLFLLNGVHSL